METYITICKIDSQQERAVCLRKVKQGLCINLEGWDGEEGGFIPSFLRNLHTASIVAVSIYIPTNSARLFPFLHTLSGIYCL